MPEHSMRCFDVLLIIWKIILHFIEKRVLYAISVPAQRPFKVDPGPSMEAEKV